jgi:hypothetical protein
MKPGKRHLASTARKALAWALGFFLAAQVVLNLVVDYWRPQLRDPEYVFKRNLVRAVRRRTPGRPLVLVLGSSRVQMGLEGVLSRGHAPVVINFGLTRAGPVAELLCLRRLLADGIHPDHVFVEVMPPLLAKGEKEITTLGVGRLGPGDLAVLRRYSSTPGDLSLRWCKGRLVPTWTFRHLLLCRFAPSLLPDGKGTANPYVLWPSQNALGWFAYARESVTAEEYQRDLAHARADYLDLLADFHIAEAADRALRELLEVCRQERIGATLLLMPEGTDFQSMYPPRARTAIDAYLARVQREQTVGLVDARRWIPDSGFWDSHHLLLTGAAAFTKRFEREALRPLFSERPVVKRQ